MDETRNTDYTPEEPKTAPEAESFDGPPAKPENETAEPAPSLNHESPLHDPMPGEETASSPEMNEQPETASFSESPVFSQAQGSMPPPFGGNTERQEKPSQTDESVSHSGEYRYSPPYSDTNAKDHVYDRAPTEYSPAPESHNKGKKKKVKTVRTFSTTALVFILIGAVILSFASGMLGALLVGGGLNSAGADATEPGKDSENGELIINKADDDDSNENSQGASDKLVGNFDISDVCAVVSASVVEITTEFNKTQYGYYQYVQEGAGSGVIISRDGYIITNSHVITDSESGKLADAIKIRLNSGDEYDAEIIGSDSDSDIALIKVEGKDFSAATVGNSDSIKVGEQVIAVGNPLGELGGTVTSGIVSATNREISVENNKMTLIQIDAAINPGNSGGGLFNTDGELIGIVNAKTTDVTVEGLGFAIPVNEAVNVAEELESHGYVTGKTHIGISLTDVTDAFTAYYYFRSESTGVYITSVQEGYNEDILEYGDRITAINSIEINSSADVKEIIQESKVGDKLTFTISRNGKLKNVEVTCYEYVPDDDVSFDGE